MDVRTSTKAERYRIDKLSDLPDEVLCSILSLLPAEESVRASILSRRWKTLPKSLHCLDLNFSGMSNKKRMYSRIAGFTDQILNYHQGNVTKCQLAHFVKDSISGKLDKWLEILLHQKHVQELILTGLVEVPFPKGVIFELPFQLKDHCFYSSTLRFMELNYYTLTNAAAFEGCANLKALKLNNVMFCDKILVGVISHCMHLEELSLIGCQGLNELEICHMNLKVLKLQKLSGMRKISVVAKGLTVLLFEEVTCPLLLDTPNLCVLQIRADDRQILERCTSPWESGQSKLGNRQSPIGSLHVFSASLNLNNLRELIILRFIFRSCTNLQNLYISSRSDTTQDDDTDIGVPYPESKFTDIGAPYPESKFWLLELYDCMFHSLKVVLIKGFLGKEREIRFVNFLISYSWVMEKIVLVCDEACSLEGALATERLLSVPRASTNLSLILRPPPRKNTPEVDGCFDTWISTL